MKKLFYLFLVLIFLFIFLKFVSGSSYWWEYNWRGRSPDREDLIKAEINKAIAIQKIAEEGITLNIIFKNKLEIDKKE